jgi:hypothetical protein
VPVATLLQRLAAASLFLSVLAANAASASAADVIPLAVDGDQCECVLDTSSDRQFLLIIGSLARDLKSREVTITTAVVDGTTSVSVKRAHPVADPARLQQIDTWARQQAVARQRPTWAAQYVPMPNPPREKLFYLFTQAGDLLKPAGYTAVTARLEAIGRNCLVYVDRDYRRPELAAMIGDVVHTFDVEVYPTAQRLGRVQDTDRDGRFTILLTPWLGRLQGGAVNVAGFVRGSDFYHDGKAPFCNRCDMLYLNAELTQGPFLRTVLAHEYTHAILLSEHCFGNYLPGMRRQDEDCWLNEALCHVVEDEAGYSWRNLDYRISAFLNAPARYPLVVEDYYGPGLWRTPGLRGATYLFLRWCADRYGPDLLPKLVRSNLQGPANLEAATGQPFEELFRGWTVALALGGFSQSARTGFPLLRRVDLLGPLDRRLLGGPFVDTLSMNHGEQHHAISGTAASYLLLHSPAGSRTRLSIHAAAGTQLQATLIRLPRELGQLSLRWVAAANPGSIHLHLTAHGVPVELEQAAWEIQVPQTESDENTSYRPGVDPQKTVRDWFGADRLGAGAHCISGPVPLPLGSGPRCPVVFKVLARDAVGRHYVAWTLVSPEIKRQ